MAERKRKPTIEERRDKALREALRFPEAPRPSQLAPERLDALLAAAPNGKVRAWTYNVGRSQVMLGAFDQYNHSIDGDMRPGDIHSRGRGGPWFLSRDEAALALRWDAVSAAAADLLLLDSRIAAYLAVPLPPGAPDA